MSAHQYKSELKKLSAFCKKRSEELDKKGGWITAEDIKKAKEAAVEKLLSSRRQSNA